MSEEKELVAEVLQTEQRWTRAHLDLDLEAIAGILLEDYRQIGPDGSLIGKAELLDSYGSGERVWQIAESSDHEVRLRGEVAVVIGRWRGKGVNHGEAFDYAARFVSVYACEDGKWKLLFDTSIRFPD